MIVFKNINFCFLKTISIFLLCLSLCQCISVKSNENKSFKFMSDIYPMYPIDDYLTDLHEIKLTNKHKHYGHLLALNECKKKKQDFSDLFYYFCDYSNLTKVRI